jgi:hypothetical protein
MNKELGKMWRSLSEVERLSFTPDRLPKGASSEAPHSSLGMPQSYESSAGTVDEHDMDDEDDDDLEEEGNDDDNDDENGSSLKKSKPDRPVVSM